jgi:hypothetical protein
MGHVVRETDRRGLDARPRSRGLAERSIWSERRESRARVTLAFARSEEISR